MQFLIYMRSGYTYARTGVDIREVAKIHKNIDRVLSSTYRTRRGKLGQVLNVRQHYAGLVEIGGGRALAIHTDGVGTKVLVAEALRKYDTVGIDCVAMNVNDVVCMGAEPFALVNYLALGKPRPQLVKQVMRGLVRGAREAGVSIVSGETAVMPDVVKGFDLAATVVGVVKKNVIVTGAETEPGDVILGLRSSGIHSNGLSLARKLLLRPRAQSVILRELLKPTRIYVSQILSLLRSGKGIHGLAHITGGGYSKLKRIGVRAKVGFMLDRLPPPQWIFREIQSRGRVSDREMYRTFNMGTGFLIMCDGRAVGRLKLALPELREVGYVTSTRSVVIGAEGLEIEVERW